MDKLRLATRGNPKKHNEHYWNRMEPLTTILQNHNFSLSTVTIGQGHHLISYNSTRIRSVHTVLRYSIVSTCIPVNFSLQYKQVTIMRLVQFTFGWAFWKLHLEWTHLENPEHIIWHLGKITNLFKKQISCNIRLKYIFLRLTIRTLYGISHFFLS